MSIWNEWAALGYRSSVKGYVVPTELYDRLLEVLSEYEAMKEENSYCGAVHPEYGSHIRCDLLEGHEGRHERYSPVGRPTVYWI